LELAGDDAVELAGIRAVIGAALGDVGAHERARVEFEASIELARSVGHGKQTAWSTCVLGRSLLQQWDLDGAEASLQEGIELARVQRWTAFLAFPEALLAEAWVRQGRMDEAGVAFEHAFALGCRVDDACWEAYGVRGLGLLRAANGDEAGAIELFEDALGRCARQRDTHRWVRAYVLDALCAVATCAEHPNAGAWVTDLAALSARTGMREFSVHAYLYRRDMGDASAVDGAGAVAVGIENPHLMALISPDSPPLLQVMLGRV
jgi:tetratricopeptide (TPR) repeat protein